MPTYLQLPPQQGGTRFGPFPAGVIQLGTDPNHCQISLAATPGIAPIHVMISPMGGGRFNVQPIQQGLELHLIQRGQTQLWPIQGPTTATQGDAVVIGGAGGPTFTLQWEDPVVAAGPVARGPTGAAPGIAPGSGGFGGPRGRSNNLASGIGAEMQRQAFARVLGRAGPLRDIYHMMYRLRSGALTNPRVIVGVIGTMAAGFVAVATSCAGLVGAILFGG